MIELSEARTAMGRALSSVANSGYGRSTVNNEFWYALTESRALDWNMALVQSAAPEALQRTLAAIEESGHQALLMLAGAGIASASELEGWVHAADMPMMAIDAPFVGAVADGRVRRATSSDAGTCAELMHQAFGVSVEDSIGPMAVLLDERALMETWVLEVDGVPASMVMTCVDGEVISVWCMATPPTEQRKGYGSALLRHVLADGEDRGAMVGLLGATPAGYPMYAATGWNTIDTWQIYAQGESVQFSH